MLPSPAQALFLRLFQRRGPWFQARTFSYSEVEDTAAAVQQLVEAGLARTDANADPEARSQIAGTVLTKPHVLQWCLNLAAKAKLLLQMIKSPAKHRICGAARSCPIPPSGLHCVNGCPVAEIL